MNDAVCDSSSPALTGEQSAHTEEIVQVPGGHRLAIRALDAHRSGNNGRWPQKRRWTPTVERPVLCERGWHACLNTRQVVEGGWFGERLWLVELAGEIVVGSDKVAAERARLLRPLPWDERVARLWACDVAEQVLPILERERPGDDRPRRAIEVARAFANGEVDDAARAAASDAAWDAASDAATSAGRAAGRAAATSAGRAAARAAAWHAAWHAARAAARDAWDATRDAARDAQARSLAVVLGLEGTILDGSSQAEQSGSSGGEQ